jgi:putative Mg2+ transporter-C (MgtC) family protein
MQFRLSWTHRGYEKTMDPDYIIIAVHLIGAILAGGVIGLERSFHGRAAGFRTHTLVCLSSSVLMLLAVFQSKWVPDGGAILVQTDPTRMAQGIMTGIGFLGAGVIYKENLSVRGLTTAASIWITAAIGILIGVGFYYPAIIATILTLGVLSAFRYIEAMMPTQIYSHHSICFERQNTMSEPQLRDLLREHGFKVSHMGYRITDDGLFEYHTVMQTDDLIHTAGLADTLRTMEQVRRFSITQAGD